MAPKLDILCEPAAVDPAQWLMGFGWIQRKDRTWAVPTLNIFQLRVCRAYQWCMAHGIPARIIGLKPRRVGGTTVFAAINYHHGRNFNSLSVSIADQFRRSNTLFRMLCGYAERDEFPWCFDACKPTRTELTLENGTVFQKETAENPNASRGDTLTSVHASEVAFWKDTPQKNARDVAVSLVNAVGDHPATYVGVESTPKGASGYFYERWLEAKWPEFERYWSAYSTQIDDTGTIWLRVFAAWHEFPEHRIRCEEWEKMNLRESFTERELLGIKKYGWDEEQIAWRRYTLKDKCLNDENRLDEEYPEDPVSCFRASGRPRFDTSGLVDIELASRSSQFEVGGLAMQPSGNVVWQNLGENEAWLRMWERPKVGCRYLISADTMTGESETERTQDSDCHSILVWRASYKDEEGVMYPPKLVSRIIPPCREDNTPLAKLIDLMSRFYGRCIVIPEVNQAYGLLKPLRDLDVPIYRMVAYDKVKQAPVSTLGWQTNEDRRRDIIDALSTRIREGEIDVRCVDVSAQFQTFIINKHGKPEARSGCKDDDVLSSAIAMFNLDAATEYVEGFVADRLPDDYDRWK